MTRRLTLHRLVKYILHQSVYFNPSSNQCSEITMNSKIKTSIFRPQPETAGWLQPLSAFMALTILAGCASMPAGSPGHDAFMADASPVRLTSSRDAIQAAQCFEDRATFLPLSTFSRDAATAAFTYRLRVSNLWFEEVRITPDGTGSRAELRVAPNLNAKWVGQFEQDRALPLRQCLGI